MNAPVRSAKPAKSVGKVEKKVPVPSKGKPGRKTDGPNVYASIRELSIGESRLFTGFTQGRIGGTAHRVGQTNGGAYCTRQVEGGVRVWRLS